MERFDAIVLGAGMVGVSAAWHPPARSDRGHCRQAGPVRKPSFGNAGVVERDGFLAMHFPGSLGELIRYAGNDQPQMHYSC